MQIEGHGSRFRKWVVIRINRSTIHTKVDAVRAAWLEHPALLPPQLVTSMAPLNINVMKSTINSFFPTALNSKSWWKQIIATSQFTSDLCVRVGQKLQVLPTSVFCTWWSCSVSYKASHNGGLLHSRKGNINQKERRKEGWKGGRKGVGGRQAGKEKTQMSLQYKHSVAKLWS